MTVVKIIQHTWRLINAIKHYKNTEPKFSNNVTYHNASITNLDDICYILTLILPDFLSRVTSHTGHFDPHIVFCVLR